MAWRSIIARWYRWAFDEDEVRSVDRPAENEDRPTEWAVHRTTEDEICPRRGCPDLIETDRRLDVLAGGSLPMASERRGKSTLR
jgi:hypothetical protein